MRELILAATWSQTNQLLKVGDVQHIVVLRTVEQVTVDGISRPLAESVYRRVSLPAKIQLSAVVRAPEGEWGPKGS